MRKVTLLIGALALVLGISQCNKQDSPLQNGGKQHIVLTTGNDGSKVAVATPTSVLNFTWEKGDVITVSGGASGTLHLTSDPGYSTATFEGDVEDVTGQPLVFSVGDKPIDETYLEQDGTIDGLKDILYFEATKDYVESGNYGNVELPLTFAVLNIDLSGFASSKSEGAIVTFSEKDTRGEPIASVTGVNASSTAVLVALPTDASPQEKVYELSNGAKVDYMTCTLNPDVYYSGNGEGSPIQPDPKPIEPELPDGKLSGLFSVSDNLKVYFSNGNLYYDGSFWKFESNQYDYRTYAGMNSCINGEIKTDGTPTGNWGLFGWSTTNTKNPYGMTISQEPSDYSGTFVDWGNNTISNVASPTKPWRTLSEGEWYYLFNTRKVKGSSGKGYTWNWATVNNINGIIIYCDGYTNATPDTDSDGIPDGCAFLPAAGERGFSNGVKIYQVGSEGYYWASTCSNASNIYNLKFYNTNLNAWNKQGPWEGLSVRLVTDAN